MAQIIKHRRGGIGTLKDVTARVGWNALDVGWHRQAVEWSGMGFVG